MYLDDDDLEESQEDADDPSNASEEDTDTSVDDGTPEEPAGADSADDASPQSADATRNALGTMLGQLQSRGVDVNALAQQAGLDTADVDDMEHGDMIALAKHVAGAHPELAQTVLGQFPAAQGILGRFLGG